MARVPKGCHAISSNPISSNPILSNKMDFCPILSNSVKGLR